MAISPTTWEPPFDGIWCGFCQVKLANELHEHTIDTDGGIGASYAAAAYVDGSAHNWIIIGKDSAGVRITPNDPNQAGAVTHFCGTFD